MQQSLLFNDLESFLFPTGEEMDILSIVLLKKPDNVHRWEQF